MPSKLSRSVVVVTGASSGIGRASALRFARKGAAVVLTARNEPALREVASECEQLGARTLVLPADVTDEAAVKELARIVVAAFGRLDVWVNNAAVALFARFEDAPPEAFRQVIETNLFGYVHGARAALPYFRKQNGGVLINVSSVFGPGGAPYLSAYIASKYAIRGLSSCLRQESRDTGIHVVTVLPASVDTPMFQHAANFCGRDAQPLEPVYPAEQVARAIVRSALRPRREVFVGKPRRSKGLLSRVSPSLGERRAARKEGEARRPSALAPPSPGNLFAPMPPAEVSGGWRRATYVRKGLLLGLLALPFLISWRRQRRNF
ncbi:SDR family oxidoreductase [Hyalangium rubrum]|uniref:SDR family oxidoreductase n=1 Tax=Hyalangium rubrum TaxID=3103134 RepID=A0ABU5HGG8_9BACT|nr:SDR family oxidoreductase [Hyalangium sp. s54d21]MDY7232551.1 SDR family oxidoreductase [Hyalangium sp. s54d21]